MQNLPNQATLPMGNCSDGLFMPKTRYRAAIHNLEDSSFGLDGGISRLIENAPHVAVPLRRPVAGVHSRALVVAGACANPGGELLLRGEGRCGGTHFGNDLLRGIDA